MRARGLFAGTIAALVLAVANPAAAKVAIAEAHIRGPGLGGAGLRISHRAAEGMWESGIDLVGGLDDARAGSIAELGLTTSELGPKYVVTYWFDHRGAEMARQKLYPYAEGGPVTYTPPGQRVAEGQPWGGAITAGWYQGSPGFFQYLVDQGLQETNPVAGAASRKSASDTVPAPRSTPWDWIALALAGLVAMTLAAPRLHRRILAAARTLR
jgi:hypothetical protein